MIYGEAVGCEDVHADDHLDVVASKRRTHDTGTLLIPVGPKHQAKGEREGVREKKDEKKTLATLAL